MWAEIPTDTFKQCQDKMKFDDFIFTDNMVAYDSMSALHVDMPKIDCHHMAKGVYTLEELIASGFPLPEEEFSYDEIRKICGYYLDTIVARLDGHTVYQTTLLSVYAHKEYPLKNELLKATILSFIALSNEIENFANKTIPENYNFWAQCQTFNEVAHPYNFDEINDLLQKFKGNAEIADIIDFLQFIVNFAIYLSKFPEMKFPEMPKLPELSEAIGFTQILHLRDLPTRAPPTKLQILPHEKSLERFKQNVALIQELTAIPFPTTFADAITQASAWSLKNFEAPIFPRIVRLKQAILLKDEPDTFYGVKYIDFLKKELTQFNTPESCYANKDFKQILNHIYYIMCQSMRAFWMPNAFTQFVFHKSLFPIWGRLQNNNLAVETSISHPKPKVRSLAHENYLKTTVATWGQIIAATFSIEYVKQFIASDVMIPDDYAFLSLVLSQAYGTWADALEKKRTTDAIYAVMQHRGPKHNSIITNEDVDRKIAPESVEIMKYKALSELWNATFFGLRHSICCGGFKGKQAEFFNYVKVYEERLRYINKMREINLMNHEQYKYLMSGQSNTLDDATKKYITARPFIKKAADANTDKSQEAYYKAMMLGSVMAPMNLGKRKTETIKFTITDDMLPSFSLA
ncbi:hypothetical protein TVAG_003140 [Trichomonas vaginalis G3]|uniref:Uncharacterized protein n=1 Tax=Trichomonas vaginalis (strain ATCC PRA-98 / G3) TaxID=412133 RepID=A2EZT7_TRIV3|nr:glucose repressible protein MAK10 family [Trichomonas vaginalis G3]EAY01859.1 hypothetical protein TVAG_003140 [Trichomonas vaginalis G3]KAI5497591.1 glucose repressible protein MAK10 family [Trichomonas vaginalis G3]|eukprot:XP_001330429.1 hypothetical protein [Trichomonas vaginalis G3]